MSAKKSGISIIIGGGEVGGALYNILSCHYPTILIDKNKERSCGEYKGEMVDYLHICLPYSKNFSKIVGNYQKEYKPRYTIIHSTVPVGTSRKLKAIHSPVRGIHPFLTEGLKTFVKYLGGKQASQVADYFRRAGLRVYIYDKSETTELMKILSTTKYGLDIEYTKEVKRLCDKYRVPFSAWTIWTQHYNEGYSKLGYSEFSRPNLTPIIKPIGGHCVRQNYELLKSKFISFIKKL